MSKARKQLRFEILLERYFSNFPRLLILNLLFFVPCLAVGGILYAISEFLIGGFNIFVIISSVILLFPFYSGVVLSCRNLARGDKDVSILSTYFKGIKENFLKFFLYGVILFLAAVFSYYSISLYIVLLSKSWVFYVVLFICFLIVIAAFFTSFYVPLMTVTFDLSIKHILKNSFLMSFGELKNNFFATVALAVVLALSFTLTMFVRSVSVLVILIALLTALFVPASSQFVISFFVYDNMYNAVTQKDKVKTDLDTAIANKKSTASNAVVDSASEDFSGVDISQLKDCDDYIYFNGRMVKQSYVLKILRENKSKADNSTDSVSEEV